MVFSNPGRLKITEEGNPELIFTSSASSSFKCSTLNEEIPRKHPEEH
jgi:hypothetical protein